MDRNDIGGGRNVDNRREIRQDVVWNLWIDRWIGRRGRHRCNPERITIGRGFRDLIRTHYATTAGLVLDDHGLPQMRRNALRNHPGNDVSGPTRCKRYDQFHRPARIGLRADNARKTRKEAQGQSRHKSGWG